jgi:hypothetical protein
MKKIIITLIALALLSSCWNKDKSIETISWSTDTETKKWINNNSNSEIENTENEQVNEKDWATDTKTNTETWKTQWKTNTEEWKSDSKTIDKSWIKKETPVTVKTDDEALETEVNNLLDDFIDSLDNYDK